MASAATAPAAAPPPPPADSTKPLRIISWNINGLAANCRRRGLAALLTSPAFQGADVVCLQETKLRPCELTVELGQAPGW